MSLNNEAYNSGFNLEKLVVPVQAAALFQAQENSLFMSGALIPMINVPAGSMSAQVPLLGSVEAQVISAEAAGGDDFDAKVVTNTAPSLTLSLIAARAVLRDVGGVGAAEIGRVLGNAVAQKFDQDVITALAGLTAGGSAIASLSDVYAAVTAIRETGEMGALNAVVSPATAQVILELIGAPAYAGGDFQTEALRNGYIGKLAGVNFYMSAHVTGTGNGFVFGTDAARIAVQGGMNIETQRRAAAVGTDIVASMASGVAVVDATRGVKFSA
jgi:hypothetical protein